MSVNPAAQMALAEGLVDNYDLYITYAEQGIDELSDQKSQVVDDAGLQSQISQDITNLKMEMKSYQWAQSMWKSRVSFWKSRMNDMKKNLQESNSLSKGS